MLSPELYLKILEYIPVSIIITNSEGFIQVTNRRVENLSGLKKTELRNKNIVIFFQAKGISPVNSPNENFSTFNDVLKILKKHTEFIILNKDSEEIFIEIYYTPLDSSQDLFIFFFKVISREKKLVYDLGERVKEQRALTKWISSLSI
jgi:PAS domain S-box-containing protein